MNGRPVRMEGVGGACWVTVVKLGDKYCSDVQQNYSFEQYIYLQIYNIFSSYSIYYVQLFTQFYLYFTYISVTLCAV